MAHRDARHCMTVADVGCCRSAFAPVSWRILFLATAAFLVPASEVSGSLADGDVEPGHLPTISSALHSHPRISGNEAV